MITLVMRSMDGKVAVLVRSMGWMNVAREAYRSRGYCLVATG